jgi:hypothetical protein
MADGRPLFPLPWQSAQYAQEDRMRALNERVGQMQEQRLRMEIDPRAMLEQQTKQAEAAAAQGFNPQATPTAQAVGQRMLGETVGYQKVPGTEMQVPAGTPPEMVQALFGNAVNNIQGLRMLADNEQDPTRKRILTGVADSAEQGLKSKAKDLSAADLAFESNASAALRYADEFENTVKKYGTFEVGSPEGSAKLGQLPYQMAIAYAKIVDPSSVAREGEVAAAQKYIIPTGLLTRNDTALNAISNFRNDVLNRTSEYSRISGRQVNIPKPIDYTRPQYQQPSQQSYQQPAQQTPQARPVIRYVRDASGNLVPAR